MEENKMNIKDWKKLNTKRNDVIVFSKGSKEITIIKDEDNRGDTHPWKVSGPDIFGSLETKSQALKFVISYMRIH